LCSKFREQTARLAVEGNRGLPKNTNTKDAISMAKAKKKQKTKKPVKKAKKASKVKKSVAKRAKAPARKAKKPAKKTAPRKAVKKTAARRTKTGTGEGSYTASRRFRKKEEGFIKRMGSKIAELGHEAKVALTGPEGKDLEAAEAESRARGAGMDRED